MGRRRIGLIAVIAAALFGLFGTAAWAASGPWGQGGGMHGGQNEQCTVQVDERMGQMMGPGQDVCTPHGPQGGMMNMMGGRSSTDERTGQMWCHFEWAEFED